MLPEELLKGTKPTLDFLLGTRKVLLKTFLGIEGGAGGCPFKLSRLATVGSFLCLAGEVRFFTWLSFRGSGS
jgi:hypothetical protein